MCGPGSRPRSPPPALEGFGYNWILQLVGVSSFLLFLDRPRPPRPGVVFGIMGVSQVHVSAFWPPVSPWLGRQGLLFFTAHKRKFVNFCLLPLIPIGLCYNQNLPIIHSSKLDERPGPVLTGGAYLLNTNKAGGDRPCLEGKTLSPPSLYHPAMSLSNPLCSWRA